MWTLPDLAEATDAELHEGLTGIRDEQNRRRVEAETPAAIDRRIGEYLDVRDGPTDPDKPPDWKQPTAAFDSYPLGRLVTHDGRTWESLRAGNPDEPGVASWREITDGDTPPEWTAPSGAHDAYQTGDRVAFEGDIYASDIDANVWSPKVHGWTKERED